MRKSTVLGILLVICLICSIVPLSVSAGQTTCHVYEGSNVETQNYIYWSRPVKSYLSVCEDGTLMRVQAGSGIDGILVEYYDAEYNLQSTKNIPAELPVFGGFYETDTNYVLITGQENPDESDNVEVFRITKYDKSWSRIDSVGLYGANTTIPFDAGTVRMDTCGNYLLIRTSHEMYATPSEYGYINHQANVTIQVDLESMTITDSFTDVLNNAYGYVSHSFNQFIKIENNNIVALEHGDAHPRSIALIKHATDVSTGTFFSWQPSCTVIPVLEFPGESGYNATGASVGGFEISDSSYFVAGNSVVQDEQNLSRTTRNVFVAAVDKSTSEVTMNWITDYEEGDGTTSTPHLVKIAADEYMLLWSRDNIVYYTKIDANGNQVEEIYSIAGNLSDCVPVCVNEKLVWYTWENEMNIFYEIDLTNFNNASTVTLVTDHTYESLGVTDGVVLLKCIKCNDEQNPKIVTNYIVWWYKPEFDYYTPAPPVVNQSVGNAFYFWISDFTPGDTGTNTEMVIENSNPDVVSCELYSYGDTDVMGTLTMLKGGTANIRIYPKYNPTLVTEYTFVVESDAIPGDVNSDGAVNAKDVASLRRYLAGGWDVSIDETVADVNGDGSINAKDVATLRRYLAGGWGVELK